MENIAISLVAGYLFDLFLVELCNVDSYRGLVANITVFIVIILCIEFDRKLKKMEARITEIEVQSFNAENRSFDGMDLDIES